MVENDVRERGVTDERVLAAMMAVPRHLFIPPPFDEVAYSDRPLPIGNGQTISQPYIVGVMTEYLSPQPSERILEIGTGTGYQAAILSQLAAEVISIERIGELAEVAERNFRTLGIQNIRIVRGDGSLGYKERSPYDGILITAATPQIPRPLSEQLAEGGRIVAPVGGRDLQEVIIGVKEQGSMRIKRYEAVRFVPLLGRYGWRDEE